MKVIKNYLWNVAYQLFIILVPLITIPYISRVLGPTGVGVNSYTNSIAQYFVLFGSIGVSLYGNRQIAYVRDKKSVLSQTFWSITVLRFITIFIALVIYLFAIYFFPGKYLNYLLAQSILILAAAFDISWFFMGMENFRVTVIRNTLIRIVSLILIFTLVKSQSDTLLYIVIISLTTFLGNLTLFPYLHRYIEKPRWKSLDMRSHIRPSLVLFIPQVAVQIYVVLNKTMLGSMVSVEASGFYDNSDKIIRIILAVVTSTGTVLLPHIANKFISGDLDGVKRSFYTSFDFVSLISVPLMFGMVAVSQKFTILFFGKAFRIVGLLMMIEAVASLFISWSNAIGTQYLLPTQQNRAYTNAVTVGAIVNILTNIPLIMIAKAEGAMLATVISEISVTCCMLFSIRNQLKIKRLFYNMGKYLVASLGMFFVIFIINTVTGVNWFAVVVEVFVGIVVYGILILMLKPVIILQMKELLSKK